MLYVDSTMYAPNKEWPQQCGRVGKVAFVKLRLKLTSFI